MSGCEAHTLAQVLAAMTVNEEVTASLFRYPFRDHAIERLETDIASQRRELIRELLAVGRADSGQLVASHMRRDDALTQRPVT